MARFDENDFPPATLGFRRYADDTPREADVTLARADPVAKSRPSPRAWLTMMGAIAMTGAAVGGATGYVMRPQAPPGIAPAPVVSRATDQPAAARAPVEVARANTVAATRSAAPAGAAQTPATASAPAASASAAETAAVPAIARATPETALPEERRVLQAESLPLMCAGPQSRAEQMVCEEPALAAADRRMMAAFDAALAAGASRDDLSADQLDWMRIREDAAAVSPRAVMSIYRQRIDELRRIAEARWPPGA